MESVPLIGWAGLKNGALLTEAEKHFDVLLTMDSNMVHQQNLALFRIAVIALKARSNRLADTRPLMPKVLVPTGIGVSPGRTPTMESPREAIDLGHCPERPWRFAMES